jgi:hypothetical protein
LGCEVPADDRAGVAQPGRCGVGPGGDPASGVETEDLLAVNAERGRAPLPRRATAAAHPPGAEGPRPQPDGAIVSRCQNDPAAGSIRNVRDNAGMCDRRPGSAGRAAAGLAGRRYLACGMAWACPGPRRQRHAPGVRKRTAASKPGNAAGGEPHPGTNQSNIPTPGTNKKAKPSLNNAP